MSTGRNTTTRDQHRAAIRRTKPPCGLCHQPIDYSLRTPDPMSFEVDHIIPVDIYLPGCPPRPQMLLNAIIELHKQVRHYPLGANRRKAVAAAEAAALEATPTELQPQTHVHGHHELDADGQRVDLHDHPSFVGRNLLA